MDLRAISYLEDTPEIVALLRTSLSDNHTKENFLWKHFENPFGNSYGLVALDKSKIIGARMFMFWEFRKSDKFLKAIRPVDTITHPDYRGKGIFKKLTLQGLEDCRGTYDFVFNTPNNNSFPGYIKMGWSSYDQNLYFRIALTFNWNKEGSINLIPIGDVDLNNVDLSSEYYRTNFTTDFAHWRYKHAVYNVAKFEKDSVELYLFYKIGKIKKVKILIIQDIAGNAQLHKSAVKALASYLGVFTVYYLDSPLLNLKFPISKKRKNSIIVLKEDKEIKSVPLTFSAGDLEGRL